MPTRCPQRAVGARYNARFDSLAIQRARPGSASMAVPSVPPSSVFQVLTCKKGSKIDVHARTEGLHCQYSVTDADGVSSCFVVWSGSNLMQSQNLMSQFQDRSRSRFRQVERNLHFQIAKTQLAAETSSASADNAKAILLIRGTLTTGESAKAYFGDAAQAAGGSKFGQTTDGVPGVVAKIFLQQVAGNVIGGCYLFRDEQSLDAYVASDLWASETAETPWQDVLVDKHTVDAEPAAGAAA